MADEHTTRPISSFLSSPRFFNGLFTPKTLQDSEPSPTSILDTNRSSINNPFEINKIRIKPMKIFEELKTPSEKFDHEGIALALIEEQPSETIYKPNTLSRKVLFASNLKIQIPESPGDYGIKTRSSQFSGTPASTPTAFASPQGFTRQLSLREMELSEEYTRVISHGPNPKTTHIYDNCVVESCCGVIGTPELKKPGPPKLSCENFLSICHTCNRNLEEDADIYIYRGEKAFCSEECRCQEMVLDGLLMNS